MKAIVRNILACCVFWMLGNSGFLSAQEYIGGTLTEDTRYIAALNPYIVIEPLIIPDSVTLTIDPGVELNFMIGTSIIADGGTLIARGTSLLPIVMTAQTENKWSGLGFINSKTLYDAQGNYLDGTIIEHVTIEQSTTGIVLSDSSSIEIRMFEIKNCDYGISMQSAASVRMHDGSLKNCSYGMYIRNSNNNLIENCTIANCDIGIFFPSGNTSRYNIIRNNNLSYNANIALFISMGNSNLQNNLIESNTVTYNNIGLHIGNGGNEDSGFTTIQSNSIRHNDIGIKLSQNADTIRNNTIELNGSGILLSKAGGNLIKGNIIQDNTDWAITLTDGSKNNVLTNNSIYNNASGIKLSQKDLKYSVNNAVQYNIIQGNAGAMILFESGPQQALFGNSFIGNGTLPSFINNFESVVNAVGNWWGTTDTARIDSIIIDKFDAETWGEVLYKPMLNYPDPVSPISRPVSVVKQLTENGVKVTWLPNIEQDLAGYKVYYGADASGKFTGVLDNGNNIAVLLPDISLSEPVAVTAYDMDADGQTDQPEGHESAFSYALAGPYAGPDDAVCSGGEYISDQATSLYPENVAWVSMGDGSFSNHNNISTAYTPGAADRETGQVFLVLVQTIGNISVTDTLQLLITGTPNSFAGNDTIVNQNDTFITSTAFAANFTALEWESTGDGIFGNAQSLQTSYIPGINDNTSGAVQLILHIYSPCGDISDTLLLGIIKSYTIEGRVSIASGDPQPAMVVAVKTGSTGPKAVASAATLPDGTFGFPNLATGNYFLYAVPNPNEYPHLLPSYYAHGYSWRDAFMLPLTENVYDVDLKMDHTESGFPAGEAAVNGFFSYLGKADSDDSIYAKPWFGYEGKGVAATLGSPAANHLVMLMNPSLTHVFAWTLTSSDGSFHLGNLPYGIYRIWGEKTGYENALSPILVLSPGNSTINGVQLIINPKNIEVNLNPADAGAKSNWYPQPANTRVWAGGRFLGKLSECEIDLISASGEYIIRGYKTRAEQLITYGIEIPEVQSGMYIIQVRFMDGTIFSDKILLSR